MAGGAASAGPEFFAGETLLRLVATALVRLSRQRTVPDPVYDDAVQSAFNQLVLRCLRTGAAAPTSVPDMARWAATKPVCDWPLGVPGELDASDGYLVDADTGAPTQQCFEWVIAAPDAAAEEFENQLMSEALTTCRAAKAPDSYTAFRRLLITQPVLTGTELALKRADLDLSVLDETIKHSYERAPGPYLRDGLYAVCARCKCLLVPVGHGGYQCELDRCRRESHPKIGYTLDPTTVGGVYQLSRPLRMFITGPGLAETDLEAELIKLKFAPEMWPNFDAYDLRITLPNYQVWAIDVKDRANPALLGRGAKPFRREPRYDRAFLVVPRYRFDENEAYGRLFAHHRPDDVAGQVELLPDDEFVRRVKSELRKIKRNRAATTGARGGRGDA